jgi:hypothetical protein
MKRHFPGRLLACLTFAALGVTAAEARQVWFDRLPAEVLDVSAPSARVAGEPGEMTVRASTCESLPLAQVRRRIIDVAAQEWAYFGFSVTDRTISRGRLRNVGFSPSEPGAPPQRRRGGFGRPNSQEFARVVDSIAGFWAATPDGAWMLERQNEIWDGSSGIGSRWRDPWSAAFISWVMCEAGLGSRTQFQRSIAHRDYIDQAIRARDGNDASALFVAYDMGEAEINPGDLLCSGSRPDYSTIDQRRRQMGDGARTHCDIVVRVEEAAGRFLTIGGNVGGTVSLKLMPAVRERGESLHPRDDVFAHLKLRADPIEADALDSSPTVRALGCTGFETPGQVRSMNLPAPPETC